MVVRRVLGGAVVAGVAVFAGVNAAGDETTRDEAGSIVESGGLGVLSFQIGDCIQLPTDADIVESVEGVPCSESHNAQVYAEFDADFDDYPGRDAVTEAAVVGCHSRFDEAIGRPYATTEHLDFTTLEPTAEGWAEGDHEVSCLVIHTGGTPWVGSELAEDQPAI